MPMTYRQANGSSPTIAENEWCVAKGFTTTHIDSCLVIVAPVGSMLFGMHLVQAHDDFFSDADAAAVLKVMSAAGANLHEVSLHGSVDDWEHSQNKACSDFVRQLGVPMARQHIGHGCLALGSH